jgi:hypothetical protein
MENQHRLISGYKDFGEEKIAIINAIKDKEKEVALLYKDLEAFPDVEQHYLHNARKDLQGGFMWLVRAVAKPVDPFVQ